MNSLNLTVDLVNSILQYLGNRPYVETVGLINEIHKQAAEVAPSADSAPEVTPETSKPTQE